MQNIRGSELPKENQLFIKKQGNYVIGNIAFFSQFYY
jgi:hypothetical protein